MPSKVEIDIEPPKEVIDFIIDNEVKVANLIKKEAQNSTAFKDKTGRLRKSIRRRKSRFEFGGQIVIATAPHAHLIEFGHKNAPPHSFLRTAKEKVISEAREIFGI